MPMTPETRAALERRRAYKAKPVAARIVTDEVRAAKDALLLADAFAAEHPADDEEPATIEWLREIGGSIQDYDRSVIQVADFYLWFYHDDLGQTHLDLNGVTTHYTPTRGQVRRIVVALGGTMKETP